MGYCVSLRPGVLKDVICFFPIQLLFSAAGLILGSVKCVDLSMYTFCIRQCHILFSHVSLNFFHLSNKVYYLKVDLCPRFINFSTIVLFCFQKNFVFVFCGNWILFTIGGQRKIILTYYAVIVLFFHHCS